jgi:dTDP-4-amino-4,6-dideoxygalactose transaminase
MKRFDQNEIQFGHHYKANYKYTIYHGSIRDGGTPGMEEYDRTALSLPLHLLLKRADIEFICKVIKEKTI